MSPFAVFCLLVCEISRYAEHLQNELKSAKCVNRTIIIQLELNWE